MISTEDRARLEAEFARDPFAWVSGDLINAIRTDDLVATLWLHRPTSTSGCVCDGMRLGTSYTLHLAEMIRRAVRVEQS